MSQHIGAALKSCGHDSLLATIMITARCAMRGLLSPYMPVRQPHSHAMSFAGRSRKMPRRASLCLLASCRPARYRHEGAGGRRLTGRAIIAGQHGFMDRASDARAGLNGLFMHCIAFRFAAARA